MVIASTAKPISFEPTRAAWYGEHALLDMAVNVHRASRSRRRPRADRQDQGQQVSVLILKSKAYISANAPTKLTRIVTSGIRVARSERRKITSTTSRIASPIVSNTAWIECWMKMALLPPCRCAAPRAALAG